jgi:general secretion pathway protein G
MRRMKSEAFTLVELLLVLVILAVLATIIVPVYTNHIKKAKIRGTIADISILEGSLSAFQLDNGRFPNSEEGLAALVQAPPDLAGSWGGPYVKQVTSDKWGHPYRYFCPAPDNPFNFLILSCGPDGQEYTEDDITQYTTDAGVVVLAQ